MGRFQNNNGRLRDSDLITDNSLNANDKNWESQSEAFTEEMDSVSVVAPQIKSCADARKEEREIADNDVDYQVMRNAGTKLKYKSRPTHEPRAPNLDPDKSFEKIYAKKQTEEEIQKLIQPNSSVDTTSTEISPIVPASFVLSKEICSSSSEKTVDNGGKSSAISNFGGGKSSTSSVSSRFSYIVNNIPSSQLSLEPQHHNVCDTTTDSPSAKSELPNEPLNLVPAGYLMNDLESFGAKQHLNSKTKKTDVTSSNRLARSNTGTYTISAESSSDSKSGGASQKMHRNKNNSDNNRVGGDRNNRNNDRMGTQQRHQQNNNGHFKKAANDEIW